MANTNNATLHEAASLGDLVLLQRLLQEASQPGEVLEAVDAHGHTPLVVAVKGGRLALVRELLGAGADPTHAASLAGEQQPEDADAAAIVALLQEALTSRRTGSNGAGGVSVRAAPDGMEGAGAAAGRAGVAPAAAQAAPEAGAWVVPANGPPLCRFFANGFCRYGDVCRYIHPGFTTAGSTGAFVPAGSAPAGNHGGAAGQQQQQQQHPYQSSGRRGGNRPQHHPGSSHHNGPASPAAAGGAADAAAPAFTTECRYFKSGYCFRGATCKYVHGAGATASPDGGAINPMPVYVPGGMMLSQPPHHQQDAAVYGGIPQGQQAYAPRGGRNPRYAGGPSGSSNGPRDGGIGGAVGAGGARDGGYYRGAQNAPFQPAGNGVYMRPPMHTSARSGGAGPQQHQLGAHQHMPPHFQQQAPMIAGSHMHHAGSQLPPQHQHRSHHAQAHHQHQHRQAPSSRGGAPTEAQVINALATEIAAEIIEAEIEAEMEAEMEQQMAQALEKQQQIEQHAQAYSFTHDETD